MLSTISANARTAGTFQRPQTARSQDSAGGVNVLPGPVAGAVSGRIELLADGTELQAALMEAVNEAKTSIKADFHLLRGKAGAELARQLARRARQGLRVQLLAWGAATPALAEAVREARQAGLNVRMAPGGANGRPAGKLIVIDDRLALVGALRRDRDDRHARRGLWRVSGMAAWEIGRQFNHDWAATGGQPLPLPEPVGFGAHALLSSVEVGGAGAARKRAKAIVLAALQGARSTVAVAIDAIDDAEVVSALQAARARGVKVRLLVGDGAGSSWSQARSLAALRRSGVALRRYHAQGAPQAIELCYAVVDGATLLFGSAAWTRESLAAGGEWQLSALGGPTVALAAATFNQDWGKALPFDPPGAAATALKVAPALIAKLSRLAKRYSPAAAMAVVAELHVGLVKIPGKRMELILAKR